MNDRDARARVAAVSGPRVPGPRCVCGSVFPDHRCHSDRTAPLPPWHMNVVARRISETEAMLLGVDLPPLTAFVDMAP